MAAIVLAMIAVFALALCAVVLFVSERDDKRLGLY
jgi:hypothetical protein